MKMEGILWKWTNYWNGWQTRWFILENGVLSYYMSQEEVSQGCKGSMKVSALEIIVNNVDNTRMDLVIPGEKHMYLRAASSHERQQWLIALGSSKACLTTKDKRESFAESNPDSVKTKKSELRLYCDLLMQQVHMIKTAASEESGPDLQTFQRRNLYLMGRQNYFIQEFNELQGTKENLQFLAKKLSDGSSLLVATCDTFIKTLEDCMKLSNVAPITKPTVPGMKTIQNERKT